MWHAHPCLWKATAAVQGLHGTPASCVATMIDALRAAPIDQRAFNVTASHLDAEVQWLGDRRPIYDVYPSVTDAFVNIDLSKIKAAQITLPVKTLLIRFKVGGEFEASPQSKILTALVSESAAYRGGRGMLLSMNTGRAVAIRGHDVPEHIVRGIVFSESSSIEELIVRGKQYLTEDGATDEAAVENMMRLIVALCLLKDNPDLIEQEPLDADREKWEQTHDLKYIEKAERRGKREWAIGKHIEVEPGFRRPHFAIRWCGKGGTDPQLRPVKGCLVRRQKIEDVPSGYLDDIPASEQPGQLDSPPKPA